MKPARLLAQARQEICDAAEYYECQAGGLGSDFTRRVDLALLDLREHPERWPIINRNVRRRLISRFPFCLLYRVDTDEIVVLAVMHLRRHPNYWVNRI